MHVRDISVSIRWMRMIDVKVDKTHTLHETQFPPSFSSVAILKQL